jgi:hypothetical protein
MLGIFCLRLACGMIGALALVSPRQVNPRFNRTHFLTVLGLTTAAAVLLWNIAGPWRWGACAGIVLAFAGSLVWSVDAAPGGKWLIGLTAVTLVVTLGLAGEAGFQQSDGLDNVSNAAGSADELAASSRLTGVRVVDHLSSAAVLGTAMTAMLMGHSYLIAPTSSLTPLLRLLGALFAALGLRTVVAMAGVYCWTASHSLVNLEDETVLWLPVRWLVGLVAPLVLAWLALAAAKIRSTQSATGILYVVVIFCFLGELLSQLLLASTGYIL